MKTLHRKVGSYIAGFACLIVAGVPVQAQSATNILPDAREGRSYFAPLSGYFDSRGGGGPSYSYSHGSTETYKFDWLQLDSSSGNLTGRPVRDNLRSLHETLTFSVTRTASGSTQTREFEIRLSYLNNRPQPSSAALSNASVHARLLYSLGISKFFADTDISLGDVLTYRADVTRPWGISLSAIGLSVVSRYVYDEGVEKYVKKYFIEGIPTRLGDYRIRISATDSAGASAYRYYTLTVDQHPADTLVRADPLDGIRLRIDLPYVEVSRDFTALYQESRCRTAVFTSEGRLNSKKEPEYPVWTLKSHDKLDGSLCLPTGHDPDVPVYSPPGLVHIPYLKYVHVINPNDELERVATVMCLDVTFHVLDISKVTADGGWILLSVADADDASQCAIR